MPARSALCWLLSSPAGCQPHSSAAASAPWSLFTGSGTASRKDSSCLLLPAVMSPSEAKPGPALAVFSSLFEVLCQIYCSPEALLANCCHLENAVAIVRGQLWSEESRPEEAAGMVGPQAVAKSHEFLGDSTLHGHCPAWRTAQSSPSLSFTPDGALILFPSEK